MPFPEQQPAPQPGNPPTVASAVPPLQQMPPLPQPTVIDMGPPAPIPAAPPVPKPPEEVKITLEQFKSLQASQAELIRLREEHEATRRQAQEQLALEQAAKGQIESSLATLKMQREENERKAKEELASERSRSQNFAIDREMAAALMEDDRIIPDAREHLMTVLRPHLNAVPEGNSFAVRTADHRDARTFLAQMLSQPKFSHFLKADSQPGTAGRTGGHLSPPTPPSQPAPEIDPNTLTMGLASILQSQEIMKQRQGAAGNVPAAVNMALGFGLKPQR